MLIDTYLAIFVMLHYRTQVISVSCSGAILHILHNVETLRYQTYKIY